jgi:hypothetical protein
MSLNSERAWLRRQRARKGQPQPENRRLVEACALSQHPISRLPTTGRELDLSPSPLLAPLDFLLPDADTMGEPISIMELRSGRIIDLTVKDMLT